MGQGRLEGLDESKQVKHIQYIYLLAYLLSLDNIFTQYKV